MSMSLFGLRSMFKSSFTSVNLVRATSPQCQIVGDRCLFVQKRFLRGAPRRPATQGDSLSDLSSDDEQTRSQSQVKQRMTRTSSQQHDRTDRNFSDVNVKPSRLRDMLHHSTTGSPDRIDNSTSDQRVRLLPEVYRRQQSRHAYRPDIDPQQTSVLLFPGQGSQFVGMGKQLFRYPNVARMFDAASQILGFDLKDVCLYGPKTDLDRTVYCQPAVVVTSLAAVERLKDESPHVLDNCVAAAGFSVGEITALIFAGALTFEDGMKLVRIRAEAMQAASEENPGGMMTVFYGADARIGFACSAAVEWCKKKGMQSPECVVANYLFPGSKVIAGDDEALKFITMNAKDFGILRHKRLPVSGAFHSLLMSPAKHVLKEAMNTLDIRAPSVIVHSNVDGKRYKNADHIRRQLPKQITSPVRWEQTMHILYERPIGTNFPKTIECGPGKSLRTILQKVNTKAYSKCDAVEV